MKENSVSTDVPQPLALDLADPAATDLATTGGKGSSLARLAAAGLPVPGGFHVTTAAYRAAVAGAPQRAVVEAASHVDPDRPETHEAAAARIAEVFAGLEIPAAVADAVRAGYSRLRSGERRSSPPSPCAPRRRPRTCRGCRSPASRTRSSNIRGEEALLRAVRDCWASLWTARAIGYRARHGIPADEVTPRGGGAAAGRRRRRRGPVHRRPDDRFARPGADQRGVGAGGGRRRRAGHARHRSRCPASVASSRPR